MNYLLVFLGGGLGSITRFLFSKLFPSITAFPLSTFLSNAVSSLILGLLIGFLLNKQTANDNIRLLVATGFCGGFSTFSTFSLETFQLMNAGDFKTALFSVLLNLVICYACIAGGFFLGKYF